MPKGQTPIKKPITTPLQQRSSLTRPTRKALAAAIAVFAIFGIVAYFITHASATSYTPVRSVVLLASDTGDASWSAKAQDWGQQAHDWYCAKVGACYTFQGTAVLRGSQTASYYITCHDSGGCPGGQLEAVARNVAVKDQGTVYRTDIGSAIVTGFPTNTNINTAGGCGYGLIGQPISVIDPYTPNLNPQVSGHQVFCPKIHGLAHEMGHSFGLQHTNNGTLMDGPPGTSSYSACGIGTEAVMPYFPPCTLDPAQAAALKNGTTGTSYFDPRPVGNVDAVGCTSSGWAYDPSDSSAQNKIDVYIDGRFDGTTSTSQLRPDVNTAYAITGNHGFNYTVSQGWYDSLSHTIKIYAIDLPDANQNALLTQRTFTCAHSPFFYLHNSNSSGSADEAYAFGTNGDIPLACNWNGNSNGNDTGGVFRPSNNTFYMRYSNSAGGVDASATIGGSGDLPLCGDWNGDGTDTIGVFRPSTGTFYLRNSNTSGPGDIAIGFGSPGDIPVAGNWGGKGADGVGVFRPSTGTFYTRTNSGAVTPIVFGSPGDKPLIGDWNHSGVDQLGVYRPSNATFYLKNTNGTITAFSYGIKNDLPVVGDWVGNGPDTIGVYRY